MNIIKPPFITKLISIFERLTSKPIIGGLALSDSMLQYVMLGGKPKAVSLKLPPGVMRGGRIIDSKQFAAVLKQFHGMIGLNDRGASIPVVVSLPPGSVYTQSFQVPNVGRQKLDESAMLNLQMISPISEEKAYMSYQIAEEMTEKYDLLGAVAERQVVDDIDIALQAANFSPVIFEFPGLALARTVSKAMGPGIEKESSMVFQISSDGLNFSIIRNGELYFDYFRSWISIQGEERQISRELFQTVITQEIQKVLNFSLSRFRETLTRVFLVAPGFEKDIQTFVEGKFGLTIIPFSIPSWSLTPHWYVVFGSALRGAMNRSRDVFLTLSRVSSRELFQEEQTIDFIVLWRNILAGILAVFLVLYGGVAYFLAKESASTKEQLAIFTTLGQQKDLKNLESKAAEFNSLVKTISRVRESTEPWSVFFSRIASLANEGRITIDRIETSSLNAGVTLSGRAPDNNTVVQFRSLLSSQLDFSDANLSISSIRTLEDGSTGFQISFKFKGASEKK